MHALDSAYSIWPTKEEAAKRLGVSVKSIERRIAAGTFRTLKRPRRGNHAETVINPDDFAKVLGEAATTALPSVEPTKAAAEIALLSRVPELVETIAARIHPTPPPLNLTLEAAAAYSGLPKRFLLYSIRVGSLPAFFHAGKHYINRQQLEEFRP